MKTFNAQAAARPKFGDMLFDSVRKERDNFSSAVSRAADPDNLRGPLVMPPKKPNVRVILCQRLHHDEKAVGASFTEAVGQAVFIFRVSPSASRCDQVELFVCRVIPCRISLTGICVPLPGCPILPSVRFPRRTPATPCLPAAGMCRRTRQSQRPASKSYAKRRKERRSLTSGKDCS